jgi:hypothetical protein
MLHVSSSKNRAFVKWVKWLLPVCATPVLILLARMNATPDSWLVQIAPWLILGIAATIAVIVVGFKYW